jgi:hypothetical protein
MQGRRAGGGRVTPPSPLSSELRQPLVTKETEQDAGGPLLPAPRRPAPLDLQEEEQEQEQEEEQEQEQEEEEEGGEAGDEWVKPVPDRLGSVGFVFVLATNMFSGGSLVVPYFFSAAGIVGGWAMTLTLSLITCHTTCILVRRGARGMHHAHRTAAKYFAPFLLLLLNGCST